MVPPGSCFNSLGYTFPETGGLLSLSTVGNIESVDKALLLKRHLVCSGKNLKPQPILDVLKRNEGMDLAFAQAYLLREGTFREHGDRRQLGGKKRTLERGKTPSCSSLFCRAARGNWHICCTSECIFFLL